ncbi:helicase HerA-like domain-containing protein [Legionella erythra]|uniref:ATPase n=1 Tax=Legionella erythra TaxID=448 RepID=A0A0W0TPS5_LEGER|nr:helicase HerA-like domain-containing protein [Legionella erythra]KTC97577.1 ATPase [Legionella erythra]
MYDDLRAPYQAAGFPALELGGIMLDETLLQDAPVNLVLKSLNRHGLIAGATGSGKTKTIQVLCEQLSQAGVPSLVMDIKGDVSGLAVPGEPNEFLEKRSLSLNLRFHPRQSPVELFTLDRGVSGVPLRGKVSDFGALLFSRMLDVNETQTGVITILFEYAKDRELPLNDLNDFKAILQYMQSDAGNADVASRYGNVSSTSVGSIMRKIIELEAQGGDDFFGEPAFEVTDLFRTTAEGQGIVSILRLMDMQDKPLLFSTFMIKLLSDVYRQSPELGDPPKPKLVLFIDEAHLIFNRASKALLNLLETMVKLIRSKGIGLIFCTQTPNDIPDAVLSQLGLKIQHALRAFTAKDRQAMKLVAQNFPPSTYYATEQLLTSLGTGEALVSALDGNGQPTPLIQCLIRAPESRMGTLTDAEVQTIIQQSGLFSRYGERQSPPSALAILRAGKNKLGTEPAPAQGEVSQNDSREPSVLEQLSKNTLFRQMVRDIWRKVLNSFFPSRRGSSRKKP